MMVLNCLPVDLKSGIANLKEVLVTKPGLARLTALPAAMRYILKAESYERRGAGRKTVCNCLIKSG